MDVDFKLGLYCGIKIDYNYDHPRSVNLSMPKYFHNNLNELQHPYPQKTQHAPNKWELQNYVATTQWSKS